MASVTKTDCYVGATDWFTALGLQEELVVEDGRDGSVAEGQVDSAAGEIAEGSGGLSLQAHVGGRVGQASQHKSLKGHLDDTLQLDQ